MKLTVTQALRRYMAPRPSGQRQRSGTAATDAGRPSPLRFGGAMCRSHAPSCFRYAPRLQYAPFAVGAGWRPSPRPPSPITKG